MNNLQDARKDILDFMRSDKKCMLITGTHQYKKHVLVMALIDKYYQNAHVLFRASGVNHAFTTPDILGKLVDQKRKAGEIFKLNNNYYCVDAYLRKDTWYKSANKHNFAIVYPIDGITDDPKLLDSIENLFVDKQIDKIFLVSWTDHKKEDVSIYNKYVDVATIYDVEEEDIHYHRRVLGLED